MLRSFAECDIALEGVTKMNLGKHGTREILDPAWAIVWFAALVGVLHGLRVQGPLGAAGVGVGLAVLAFAAAAFATSGFKRYRAIPLVNPWCLPWGGIYGVLGAMLMVLGEPWSPWGFGVIVIGLLNLVLGGIAIARSTNSPEQKRE
jgi:hypothetical protein